jgi:hypothetical protein
MNINDSMISKIKLTCKNPIIDKKNGGVSTDELKEFILLNSSYSESSIDITIFTRKDLIKYINENILPKYNTPESNTKKLDLSSLSKIVHEIPISRDTNTSINLKTKYVEDVKLPKRSKTQLQTSVKHTLPNITKKVIDKRTLLSDVVGFIPTSEDMIQLLESGKKLYTTYKNSDDYKVFNLKGNYYLFNNMECGGGGDCFYHVVIRCLNKFGINTNVKNLRTIVQNDFNSLDKERQEFLKKYVTSSNNENNVKKNIDSIDFSNIFLSSSQFATQYEISVIAKYYKIKFLYINHTDRLNDGNRIEDYIYCINANDDLDDIPIDYTEFNYLFILYNINSLHFQLGEIFIENNKLSTISKRDLLLPKNNNLLSFCENVCPTYSWTSL